MGFDLALTDRLGWWADGYADQHWRQLWAAQASAVRDAGSTPAEAPDMEATDR